MGPIPFLPLAEISGGHVVLAALAVVVIFFILMTVLLKRYIKVGPNEALIISGRKHTYSGHKGEDIAVGFRIVKGGGTFVWPFIEKVDILSMELLTLDVKLEDVYTITGVPVYVDGVAQIKVKGDEISIATASEQFLGKDQGEIMQIALQTVEGHLRAIVGTLTVEEIYKNREMFSQKVQEVAAGDLANMGLTVVSFTLREIKDKQGYLDALGRPRIAQVKRDATIAEAEASRDATIKSAQANQEAQQAKFGAETRIAEANQSYEVKKAEYQVNINCRKADSDLAYDLERYKVAQQVKAEEIKVQVIEREQMIDIQEKEISRRQKELEATIQKPADAERYKIETLANAQRFKYQTEAEGQALATKSIGFAEADASRAKGIAVADVIKAQGFSEAEAMTKKADAWKCYNEAALAQIIVEKLPEIVRAAAEPLAKTEKMIVINAGSEGGGASKITKDVTTIVSQVPPIIEALTGLKLEDLIARLPGMGKKDGEKK
ncbi:MAG: SPFH domain-containing protein [Planctomycetota bacterium]